MTKKDTRSCINTVRGITTWGRNRRKRDVGRGEGGVLFHNSQVHSMAEEAQKLKINKSGYDLAPSSTAHQKITIKHGMQNSPAQACP
jgi:hypothetical protein